MKKKNILILLLIPFIIGLISIITVNVTVDIINPDILGISWKYQDYEGFKLRDERYELKAVGVAMNDVPIDEGNGLIWSLKNEDPEDDTVYAEIVTENGRNYLKTYKCGNVVITCSNQKKNVFRTMTAVIYENGAMLINPVIGSSQNNIDNKIYYGAYDFKYNNDETIKVPASINLKFSTIPSSIFNLVSVKDYSEDIIDSIDLKNGIVTLKENSFGDAFITLSCSSQDPISDVTYKFNVVENGVNVYTYNDLLNCTNYSTDGEIVVLRKSFESLDNAFVHDSYGDVLLNEGMPQYKENNIELFGNYDFNKQKFSFENEIYSFETTFNQEYIKQWNEFSKTSKNYKPISNQVKAGIHVQKDFYGNGYTINLHNLTFPTERIQINENGAIIEVPQLGLDNLFRGPLPFYTLGDPNGLPLIKAYGQDNVGMYIDGDNITVNDINMKNCDFGNSLSNLEYVGTVVDVHGNNDTIKNSRLANGKNVLRCFSNVNFKLVNSMLSYSRNFLMQIGTNEYIKVDPTVIKTFIDVGGNEVLESISSYLSKKENIVNGDSMMNEFLAKTFDIDTQAKVKKSIMSIQEALNDKTLVEGKYKGTIEIDDTFFYRSGISSISLDTLFNGPFLLNGSPSLITDIFSSMSYESKPLVPLAATMVSGLSYPVDVKLKGNTKFFDYKVAEKIDLTGLINENISTIANSIIDDDESIGDIIGGNIRKITIDDIFPLRNILIDKAGSKYTYIETIDDVSTRYINIPIAYYGGGANLSNLDMTELNMKDNLSDKIEIDLLTKYLNLTQSTAITSVMKSLMMKTVTTVTGFEPFNFICFKNNGYLFKETPNVDELKDNLKGGN